MALSEWHLAPEYINRRWTEEELLLMGMKRNAKLRRLNPGASQPDCRQMSNADFFRKHRIRVKEV
jgi:hypothetical protein